MADFLRMLALTGGICVLLCGCVPHTELNEKVIVEAVGIDSSENGYEVTIQYCSLTGSGGQSKVDITQPNTLTATGNGENVYSALNDAELKIGRELMMGVNQLIILGSEASKESLSDILSFATTYSQIHPDMLVCTAENKASEIFTVKFTEGTLSTERLMFLFTNGIKSGIIPSTRILDLFIDMKSASKSFCLPRISVVDEGTDASENGTTVEISGGTVFSDARAAGVISRDELSGIALLSGDCDSYCIEAQADGQTISVGLYNIRARIVPDFSDGKTAFKISLFANGEFLDTVSGEDNAEFADELEANAEKKLKELISDAIASASQEYGADLLRLETFLRHYDYDAWRACADNWHEIIKNADFSFDVVVKINRYGLEE